MNQANLKQRLKNLNNQLNILREREAKYGGRDNTPLDLLNQIEDYQTAIGLVEARLAGKISAAALTEQLASLNLSPAGGRTELIFGTKINIGTLVVPAVPVLAGLLVFIALVTVAAWLYFVPAKMPLNTFNVAVAEFGQIDANGRVSSSPDGRNLSEWMFRELQAEYKNWPAGQPVAWHDSMGPTQKRVQIGLISGQTPAQRNQAAQELAQKIGANMVIYGNIAVHGQPNFTPQFYIAEIRNEADEIIGRHQLGAPIEVRLPINLYDERTSSFFEGKLGARIDALLWFTRGLALDLSGRHQDALTVFQEAETQLSGWANNQGKEILYYFLGREALYLGRYNPANPSESDPAGFLNQAEAAFNQALVINSGYSRARIGLGGVYLQRGQHLPPAERLQTNYLTLSIEQYQLAVEAGVKSAESQVELRGHLGLGSAHRLLGEAQLHAGQYTEADPNFDQAIAEINRALALLPPNQHRLLAQAYLDLGAAYEQKAYVRQVQQGKAQSKPWYEEALSAYQQCSNQADQEFYDSLLQELKTNYCDPYRQDVQAVLDSL